MTSISDSASCLPWVRSFSVTTASASSFTTTLVYRLVESTPPQLGGVHLEEGALFQIDLGPGVHHPLAGALPLAVVLLHVLHPGVLPDVEGVHPVVLGLLAALVVDTAAGHDDHVAVGADVEVVVHQIVQPGLGDEHRDVHRLVLGAVFDVDVNAGLVGLGDDVDVGGGVPGGQLPVLPDVIGPLGGWSPGRRSPAAGGCLRFPWFSPPLAAGSCPGRAAGSCTCRRCR